MNLTAQNNAEDSPNIDRRNAYHEAGHAVASYLVDIPFIRINVDHDPEMNNNPGILWNCDIIRGPKFADDPQAWLVHQSRVLFIDFAGRAAERFIRSKEVPFPVLTPGCIELVLDAQETARDDLCWAWERYIGIKTQEIKRLISDFDCLALLKSFENEYRNVCLLLMQQENCLKIDMLADLLLSERSVTYDKAYMIM